MNCNQNMNQYLCLRCFEPILSVEGLHCNRCDKSESSKNVATSNLPSPIQKPGNAGPRRHVQAADANAEKSGEDVKKYICLRCLEAVKSVEGLHCNRCDKSESSKNVATSNLPFPIQKPGNAGPRRHVQAADAGVQRPEEDLIFIEVTTEESSESTEESIETTDNESAFLNKTSECRSAGNDAKKGFTTQGELSQDSAPSFSQDSSSNAELEEKCDLLTSDLVSDHRRTRKRQHSPDPLSSPPKKSSLE